MSPEDPPQREVVTGEPGRRRAATPAGSTAASAHAGPDGPDARLDELMRGQLRGALKATALLVLLFGPMPLVFALLPAVAGTRIAGVGIGWIVPVLLVCPTPPLIGRWYVHRAERAEAYAALPAEREPDGRTRSRG